MVVDAESGVQCQPTVEILTKINVSGYFILVFVHQIAACAGLLSCHIFRPCLAAIAEPVEAQRDAVAGKETGTLIKRYAHHVVARMETSVLRRFAGAWRVAVVNPMLAPVVEDAQCAGRIVIFVVQ